MVYRVLFLVADLGPDVDPFILLRWRRRNALLSASALPKPWQPLRPALRSVTQRLTRRAAVAEIVDRADQRAANVITIIRQIQRSGATSLRQIAEALNARGINAPRGGQWHATSVRNVMARA
jgi:hypothetical protein